MSSITSPRGSNQDGSIEPYLVISGQNIGRLEYLPDGRHIVTGSLYGTIAVWNLESGKQEWASMEHRESVMDLVVTWDGTKIVSSDVDGRIKMWDVESHKLVKEWTDPERSPRISISPEGLVAVGQKNVGIYTMEGRQVDSVKFGEFVYRMCFSPNGNKLACATDGDIRVYDVNSGTLILCPFYGEWLSSMVWSRDGSRLFSGSDEEAILCWNSDTGHQIGHPWTGHTNVICSLSLSPDGSVLASASWDGTVRFWNATTGDPIWHLQHDHQVDAVRFSPSGESVVSAGVGGKIYIWRVVEYLRQFQTSNFSANFPPPPDLTHYLSRTDDHYVAGGGFGDVYRCWYRDDSPKEVAVKAFRFTFAMDGHPENRPTRMLRRELGIWRRLDHINVVPFLGIAYGFGMHGAMSLVSLWMPNESLPHFLAKHDHNLGLQHRLQFLLDISNGLHYLHSFPVVHGDLSCNNVLLDADYTARLADFGYASLIGNIPEALTYLQISTARPGALRWIAPEQVDPDETLNTTTKTDIYSFGCIALQVLSGKQPWSEVREDSAIVLRLAKGHTPGRPESRTLNDSHWNLIQDCWAAIEERPAAEAIISIIKQFLSHCPQSPPLCDLLPARSSGAELGAESLLSISHAPTDSSSTHVIQAASGEDDRNSVASLSDVTGFDRPKESKKRQTESAYDNEGAASLEVASGSDWPRESDHLTKGKQARFRVTTADEYPRKKRHL